MKEAIGNLKKTKTKEDFIAGCKAIKVYTVYSAATRRYPFFTEQAARSAVLEHLMKRAEGLKTLIEEVEKRKPERLRIRFSQGVDVCYNYSEETETRIEHKTSGAETYEIGIFIQKFADNYIDLGVDRIKRHTIKVYQKRKGTDLRATCSAFRANFTHSADAAIAREITISMGSNVALVHDSAGVGVLELNRLTRSIQRAYSRVTLCCGNRTLTFYSKAKSRYIWL